MLVWVKVRPKLALITTCCLLQQSAEAAGLVNAIYAINQGAAGRSFVVALPRRLGKRPIGRPARSLTICAARGYIRRPIWSNSVQETLTYYAFPDIHWQESTSTSACMR